MLAMAERIPEIDLWGLRGLKEERGDKVSARIALDLVAEIDRLRGLVVDADRAVKLLLRTSLAQDVSGQLMIVEARAIGDKLHAEAQASPTERSTG